MKNDSVTSCGLTVTAEWNFSKVYGRSGKKEYTGKFRVSYNGDNPDLFKSCLERANREETEGSFNWVMVVMENLLNWKDRTPIINLMVDAMYQYVAFDREAIKRFYSTYMWGRELGEEGIEIALHICK